MQRLWWWLISIKSISSLPSSHSVVVVSVSRQCQGFHSFSSSSWHDLSLPHSLRVGMKRGERNFIQPRDSFWWLLLSCHQWVTREILYEFIKISYSFSYLAVSFLITSRGRDRGKERKILELHCLSCERRCPSHLSLSVSETPPSSSVSPYLSWCCCPAKRNEEIMHAPCLTGRGWWWFRGKSRRKYHR